MTIKLDPIDNFVREGFAAKLRSQFRCPTLYVSSPDKLRNLSLLLEGKPVEYPYMFLVIQNLSANTDSYVPHSLARRGLAVQVNDDSNQAQMVRLIPVNFEVEITFITNKYSGDLDSVEGYTRRWLITRRIGSLQFNVNYGLLNLPISYTMGDSVPITPRESPTEGESVYQVVANATIHGYVSEPQTGTRGIVNQIQLAETHPANVPGQLDGAQFFPF